jgi:hypothetical protein
VVLENKLCIFWYSAGLTRKEIQEGNLCSLITIHFHFISGKRQALFFAAMPTQTSFSIVPPTPKAGDQDAIVQQLNILPVADKATFGFVKLNSPIPVINT